MKFNLKVFVQASLLSTLLILASCGGSGGTDKSKTQRSPTIQPAEFVAALNKATLSNRTELMLDIDETIRAKQGGGDWFVIYDSSAMDYKAVNLRYIRELVYFDYMASDLGVASKFNSVVRENTENGNRNGVKHLDGYEVVDYNKTSGYYEGRVSGHLYEDEIETTDVSLLAKDKQLKSFIQKAANVSFAYSISMETSMSLVSLGTKIEKMYSQANGEFSSDDQVVLLKDLQILTGVSVEELQAAGSDSLLKADMLDKIAKKVGTSSQNLEQKLLPEIFGISL